jgi:CubicO group peptidase (beta-lactamase class C family)
MAFDPSRSSRRTVLKSAALGAAACTLGDVAAGPAEPASRSARGRKLPRTSPEAAGIPPTAILAFIDAVEQKVGGLHSFMLLRHGQVAAEGWWAPYAPQYPHTLFSLSKSFTSTAVGLAVSEGHLTVDAPVLSFFPGDAPAKVSDNLAAMQVRHLLTMSTGHDKDATGPTVSAPDGNWVKAFLSLPVEHEPGTKFVYNSAATYMLSAIVQKLTGVTVLEYLHPRLFDPLGIENPTWENCPRGINKGGWGLSVKTEDIARFGQLYLQKGQWKGRQLVPEKWVAEATSKQISNGTGETSDWTQGYGYQFWRCRHGAYRGDGAFGQYCIVMPEQDAVLAITSGVSDMQAVLNAVWDHLLPAIQPNAGTRPNALSVSAANEDLPRKLAHLAVHVPEGQPTSPTAARVSGRTWRFEPNEEKMQSGGLVFRGNRCTLTLENEHGARAYECGHGEWVRNAPASRDQQAAKAAVALTDQPNGKVAASGAWTDADTFTVKLCFYETPFIQTVTCQFAGDQVTVNRKMNVGFGPTERPTLVGHLT